MNNVIKYYFKRVIFLLNVSLIIDNPIRFIQTGLLQVTTHYFKYSTPLFPLISKYIFLIHQKLKLKCLSFPVSIKYIFFQAHFIYFIFNERKRNLLCGLEERGRGKIEKKKDFILILLAQFGRSFYSCFDFFLHFDPFDVRSNVACKEKILKLQKLFTFCIFCFLELDVYMTYVLFAFLLWKLQNDKWCTLHVLYVYICVSVCEVFRLYYHKFIIKKVCIFYILYFRD